MIEKWIRVTAAAAALLTLAACGGAPEARERPPTSTERTPVARSWTSCENASRGFAVRYPADWHTDSLRPEDACRAFHPDPFELVDGTDCCPWALELHVADMPLERMLASYGDPLYFDVRARAQVDGSTRAVKLVLVATGEGLHDEGTRIYAYLIEHGEETVTVQTTAAPGEHRYDDWTRVVDEAARTIVLAARATDDDVVNVFFANERLQRDPHSCGEAFPRERRVAAELGAEGRLAAALARLLEGPTAAERDAGYSSWFSDETAGLLRSVEMRGESIVRVDFDDFSALLDGANTSCGSAHLLASLNETVRAVAGAREPVYSFRGDCAAFYEWLQGVAPDCPG